MNKKLYNQLLKQYQDSVPYSHYQANIKWVFIAPIFFNKILTLFYLVV